MKPSSLLSHLRSTQSKTVTNRRGAKVSPCRTPVLTSNSPDIYRGQEPTTWYQSIEPKSLYRHCLVPLRDSADRHVYSSPLPSANLLTEDESVVRVKEERAKEARNIFIVHLNVNSLQNKIEEVAMLIDEFKVHVVFLKETKTDRSYPNSQFAIEKYRMYRNVRKKGGGGALAYVSSKLASKRLSLPCSFRIIEVLSIEITLGRHEAVMIRV